MKRHRDLLEVLRANGMRITAGRRVLLQQILDRCAHDIELREIHEHLARELGRVDRTSVYRNLVAFERLGIVRRLKVANRGVSYRYVLDQRIHRFYICKACGNARRGKRALFERIEGALRATPGFREANLSVVFYGTCGGCAPRRK